MSKKLHSKDESKLVLGDREKVPLPVMNGNVKDRIQAEFLKGQDGGQKKATENKSIGIHRKPQKKWECLNFKNESVAAERDLNDEDDDDDEEEEAEEEEEGEAEEKDVNPYFDLRALRSHYTVSSQMVYLWKGVRPKSGTSQGTRDK